MKISEMTCDQATETMLRLSGPFARLSDDDEIMKMFDEIKGMLLKGLTPRLATIKMVPRFVTFCLAKHKKDLYEIVGALLLKPVGAVGKMNFLKMCGAISDSFDEDTQSFFTQLGEARKNRGKGSSAASYATDGMDGTP